MTIDTFKVAFASTVLTSAFMLIFKYDDNVALQLELFSEYEKLQGSMQSYLATGRLYVRSNLLLTPLLANSQTGQAMQASRPEVEARPIDEVEADEASSQIAPDATAVAWIYKLATFIEYVDNELSRLRSETIFHLDPSAVPTTQDILNQLESFGDSPVVVPSNDPERAPVVEPVAPAP